MADDVRRFDQIERVVRDTRRKVDDVESTVLARLATHTHNGTALDDLEVDVTAATDVAGLKAALLAYIASVRG